MTAAVDDVVKTYRYLRLALVVLVVLLAVAVLIEWQATGRSCLQTSISGYYYTPARGVLVGSLVAMGACLVVLKGSDEREDVLLNLAGMLAPVVAFVPTPDAGGCRSVPVPVGDTAAAIGNNVGALLAAGLLGVLVTVAGVLGARRAGRRSRAHLVGTTVSAALLAAGFGWFHLDRTGFAAAAHYTAAVGLFGCFVAVVWLNARGLEQTRRPGRAGAMLGLRTRYALIAVGMLVVPAVLAGSLLLRPWAHVLLWIEGSLIVLFAAFWLIQTHELWHEGVRAGPSAPTRMAP